MLQLFIKKGPPLEHPRSIAGGFVKNRENARG